MSNIIKKSDTKPPGSQEYKPEKDMGFTYVALSIMIFIFGMMISLYYSIYTYVDIITVLKIYGSFVLFALLLPKKIIYKLKLIHYERIIIAFTGFPMLFLTLFFVLNYYIIIDEQVREYDISGFYIATDGSGAYFKLNNPDEYYWKDAPFKIDEIKSARPKKAKLTVGKGIFGVEVEKRLVLE